MLIGSNCNGVHAIGLLDYAYLALNAYHEKDNGELGVRPKSAKSIKSLRDKMKTQEGWFQLDFPGLSMPHEWSFHAEFYAKVYRGKIQHLMYAFRGTTGTEDYIEDARDWWNTVLPGGDDIHLSVPHYWSYAQTFIMKCNSVIKALDDHNLLATYCQQHATGHSLGAALANLVAAKGPICQPPHIKSHLPVMPNIISFNPPGVGGMNHIDKSPFAESQVISMRAKYDMVSALGEAYGYVINNLVPDGMEKAKHAFEIQDHLQTPTTVKDILCHETSVCTSIKRAQEVAASHAVLQQHFMGHFLKMLDQNPDVLMMSFEQLRSWAENHGGQNHDLSGPILFAAPGMAKAA